MAGFFLPPGAEGAEASGKMVLLYEPSGLLGGTFTCSRCGASAPQPDLLDHLPDCGYLFGPPPATDARRGPGRSR